MLSTPFIFMLVQQVMFTHLSYIYVFHLALLLFMQGPWSKQFGSMKDSSWPALQLVLDQSLPHSGCLQLPRDARRGLQVPHGWANDFQSQDHRAVDEHLKIFWERIGSSCGHLLCQRLRLSATDRICASIDHLMIHVVSLSKYPCYIPYQDNTTSRIDASPMYAYEWHFFGKGS